MRAFLLLACLWGLGTTRPGGGALQAQARDAQATRALIERAVARRAMAEADGAPRRWAAQARGTMLFLAGIGEDPGPPRLIKADELAVEVYWEAPGLSKQTIVAWRDRAWLPTDIQYHRDHLGIVTNDHGPLIRLGEGDEVRDVPHPLSVAGAPRYAFALVDSITVESGDRRLQVHVVEVRPLDATQAAVVGTLYLEVTTAALVRFQFSFTRAAYRQGTLEEITVSLENALYGGRHWLPWRQELEIRRRAGVVDFPSIGIIRARWRLEGMVVDDEAPRRSTTGVAIDGLRSPGGPDSVWVGTLEQRVEAATGPLGEVSLEDVRRMVRRVLHDRLGALNPGGARPAFRKLSDLVRVNRVEGIRLGAGLAFRPGGGAVTVAPWLAVGSADRRWSGRVQLRRALGTTSALLLHAERAVVDVDDEPVISPLVNSLLAQEAGRDHGDWVERRRATLGASHRWSGGLHLSGELGAEDWRSRSTAHTPARGRYRPNPPLGGSRWWIARAQLERPLATAATAGPSWRTGWEVGAGESGSYLRLTGAAGWTAGLGPGELALSGRAGWASRGVPLARSFAIGGWGTLPGEPYRGLGGRGILLSRMEYLSQVPFPELPLGSYGGTGSSVAVGPFLASGAAWGRAPGLPWSPSEGTRTVAGIVLEVLHRLVRLEAGVSLSGGGWGLSVDVAKPWWGIL